MEKVKLDQSKNKTGDLWQKQCDEGLEHITELNKSCWDEKSRETWKRWKTEG